MNFIIPFISEALGNSVIYEEYKGNFTLAYNIAEKYLKKAYKINDLNEIAKALLSLGIVCLMQGTVQLAEKYFQEITKLDPPDKNIQFRAFNYSFLGNMLNYNTLPDGNGSMAEETTIRRDNKNFVGSNKSLYKILRKQCKETKYRIEKSLVYEFLCNIKSARATIQESIYISQHTSQFIFDAIISTISDFEEEVKFRNADPSFIAYAETVKADLYRRSKEYEKANENILQALKNYQEIGDKAGVATCQMIKIDWMSAPFSSPVVWNFAIKPSNSEDSNLTWTIEEEEFIELELDYGELYRAYAGVEKLFDEVNAPRGVAAIELRYGYLAILEEDFERAVKHLEKSRGIFNSCGDMFGFWLTSAQLTLCKIAISPLSKDIDVALLIGEWGLNTGSFSYTLGLGLLFGRVGRYWLIQKGDYERSLICYRLAEILFHKLGTIINYAQSLVDQGNVYFSIGETKTALIRYEQAIELYTQNIDKFPSLIVSRWLYSILTFIKIYNLYKSILNPEGMQISVERIEKQLAYFTTASEILKNDLSKSIPKFRLYAVIEYAKSIVNNSRTLIPFYQAQHAKVNYMYSEAGQFISNALLASQTLKEADINLYRSLIYCFMKNYSQAKFEFHQYLTQGGTDSGFIGTLGNIMAEFGGKYGKMEKDRQQERNYEQAFNFMVNIKMYNEAKDYLNKLEQLAENEWWKRYDHPWQSLTLYAEMYEGLNLLENALEHYQNAITLFEKRRQLIIHDELKITLAGERDSQDLYFQATRCAIKLYKKAARTYNPIQTKFYAELLFNFAEHGKARALLDLIANTITTSSKSENQIISKWRQLNSKSMVWNRLLAQVQSTKVPDKNHIIYLKQQIDNNEYELQRIEKEIENISPNFYQLINPNAQIISLKDVSALLSDKTAIFQYYYLEEEFLAWAITNQGIVKAIMEKSDTRKLSKKISDFHTACANQKNWEHLESYLTDNFLKPFADILNEKENLIIIPFGSSHILPFHVLKWKNKHLIETHTISYLPSASALQFLRHKDDVIQHKRILAIGNPKNMVYYPSFSAQPENMVPLPAAQIEASFVTSLYPKSKGLLYDNATKENILKYIEEYPLVHFATHGHLSQESPLLSSILLANGESLNVYELMSLQLNTELVVLSACKTGLGETTRGDDVLGLTRGLLGAGARNVVVSLWQVNDIPTSLLMGQFYNQLHSGKTPAAALQIAQNYILGLGMVEKKIDIHLLLTELKKLGADKKILDAVGKSRDANYIKYRGKLKNYAHPFFWAPFILIG